jgi:hypothetical protein
MNQINISKYLFYFFLELLVGETSAFNTGIQLHMLLNCELLVNRISLRANSHDLFNFIVLNTYFFA